MNQLWLEDKHRGTTLLGGNLKWHLWYRDSRALGYFNQGQLSVNTVTLKVQCPHLYTPSQNPGRGPRNIFTCHMILKSTKDILTTISEDLCLFPLWLPLRFTGVATGTSGVQLKWKVTWEDLQFELSGIYLHDSQSFPCIVKLLLALSV